MKDKKLSKLLEGLRRVLKLNDKMTLKLYDKYIKMDEKDIVKDIGFNLIKEFDLDDPIFNYVLDLLIEFSPDIAKNKKYILEEVKKQLDNSYGDKMSLEENHKLLEHELIRFTKLLNKYDIDYFLVGAVPCFIRSGIELFRYHDDIDIMVNEEDLGKLKELFLNIDDYDYSDDRFPSINRYQEILANKPPHTVMAQNKNNEFHLGFFSFIRGENQEVIMSEYEHRLEDGIIKTDLLLRPTNIHSSLLKYPEEEINYQDTSFKASSIENVYNIKSYTRRVKDIVDMKKLEEYVDKDKLKKIKANHMKEIFIKDIDNNIKKGYQR